MEKRETNPKKYTNKACCDVCGLENLPKKELFFWHCSFCRWDMCDKCATKRGDKSAEGRENAGDKRRGSADDAAEAPAAKNLAAERLLAKRAAAEEEQGFTRARREIWLPTDTTAVNRAPTDATAVVSDWVEGVPI
jgi:hypothetical protein